MRDKSGNFSSIKGNIYTRQWLPQEPPKALVLLVHGMAEHCGRYQHMGKYLTLQGYALCGLDLPGHGKSSKKFIDSSFTEWIEDSNEILNKVTSGPQILIGSSMGGWIAIKIGLLNPKKIKGILTIAAAPDFTKRLWRNQLSKPQKEEII